MSEIDDSFRPDDRRPPVRSPCRHDGRCDMSGSVRIGRIRYALSNWQAASLRPWDEGVYERAAPAGPYACWSGKAWRLDAPSPAEAARQTGSSPQPAVAWRGLAEPSGQFCPTCRGHTVVDRGIHPETGEDLLGECEECG